MKPLSLCLEVPESREHEELSARIRTSQPFYRTEQNGLAHANAHSLLLGAELAPGPTVSRAKAAGDFSADVKRRQQAKEAQQQKPQQQLARPPRLVFGGSRLVVDNTAPTTLITTTAVSTPSSFSSSSGISGGRGHSNRANRAANEHGQAHAEAHAHAPGGASRKLTFKGAPLVLDGGGGGERGEGRKSRVQFAADPSPQSQSRPQPQPPAMGEVFSRQHFITLGAIGRGQNGSVMLALHLAKFRLMALKNMTIYMKDARRQLIEELKTFARNKHRNLVELLGVFFDEGKIVLALEYMNAGALSQWVERNGPLSDRVAASVMRQAFRGLRVLHDKKYLHGDIKPENILISLSGEAKIADFGLAREVRTTRGINDKGGTRLYLSPERFASRRFSFPSDIWAMGLTVFTLVETRSPYVSTEYWGLWDEIVNGEPPQLDAGGGFGEAIREFVGRCLLKDPEARWSCSDLLGHRFLRASNEVLPVSEWQQQGVRGRSGGRGEEASVPIPDDTGAGNEAQQAEEKRLQRAVEILGTTFRELRHRDLSQWDGGAVDGGVRADAGGAVDADGDAYADGDADDAEDGGLQLVSSMVTRRDLESLALQIGAPLDRIGAAIDRCFEEQEAFVRRLKGLGEGGVEAEAEAPEAVGAAHHQHNSPRVQESKQQHSPAHKRPGALQLRPKRPLNHPAQPLHDAANANANAHTSSEPQVQRPVMSRSSRSLMAGVRNSMPLDHYRPAMVEPIPGVAFISEDHALEPPWENPARKPRKSSESEQRSPLQRQRVKRSLSFNPIHPGRMSRTQSLLQDQPRSDGSSSSQTVYRARSFHSHASSTRNSLAMENAGIPSAGAISSKLRRPFSHAHSESFSFLRGVLGVNVPDKKTPANTPPWRSPSPSASARRSTRRAMSDVGSKLSRSPLYSSRGARPNGAFGMDRKRLESLGSVCEFDGERRSSSMTQLNASLSRRTPPSMSTTFLAPARRVRLPALKGGRLKKVDFGGALPNWARIPRDDYEGADGEVAKKMSFPGMKEASGTLVGWGSRPHKMALRPLRSAISADTLKSMLENTPLTRFKDSNVPEQKLE